MNSYYLFVLLFVLVAKIVLADNETQFISPKEQTEYEKEQAIIKATSYHVEPTVPEPETHPIPLNDDIVPAGAPNEETPKTEELPPIGEDAKTEGSSHYGTIAITGAAVALIAGVGYKSYKKDLKFKIPEIAHIPGLATAKEAKEANTNKDVTIEMEVLLSETSEAENYCLAKNRAYKCMIAWTPKQADEIILRRGDLVCVKECFSDGYTLGRNLSTKFDGIFPTCCLCRPEQNVIGSELIVNGKFSAIPKRVNSKMTHEKRARRASRGVSFLSTVPGWNKNGFTALNIN